MTFSITSLTPAIIAQRGLRQSQPELLKSLQRLSTGLRINEPRDDVAGASISQRTQGRIEGFTRANSNVSYGISIVRTAQEGLQAINDGLIRIRDISVLAANATTSAEDRASLQATVTEIVDDINKIAKDTQFNDTKLLDGSYFAKFIQTGADRGDKVEVGIESATANVLGAVVDISVSPPYNPTIYQYTGINTNLTSGSSASTATAATKNTNSNNVVSAQSLTITGTPGAAVISVSNFDTAAQVAAKVNLQTATTGVTASAETKLRLSNATLAGDVELNLGTNGGSFANISTNIASASDLSALVNAINAEQGTTGVTASLGGNASEVILTNATGKNIIIEGFDLDNGSGRIFLNPIGTVGTLQLGQDPNDSVVVNGYLKFESDNSFTIKSTANATNNLLGNVASGVDVTPIVVPDPSPPPAPSVPPEFEFQSLLDLSVSNQESASDAIEIIDGAIDTVNLIRGSMGAYENRFINIASDLADATENLEIARSRIMDADFAKEAAIVAKGLVLQEIGVSVLSQANVIPELALSLLTGN